MGRMKRELMSLALWRGEEEAAEEFWDAKLKVTKQPGVEPVMHVPRRKNNKPKCHNLEDDDSIVEVDPQLCYSFSVIIRVSSRVFSIDTVVKPLLLAMPYNISCNLSFFTQFLGKWISVCIYPESIKSLGIGQEEKARRVR
ncbi:hypothetical protein CIPAW_09G026000 [Carya illinoinensis]|uniref:Uncharacterized protein n=1 Tax=Carya illinoinensis TaxID=32201 RepID=A0A8T1PJU2_CARIL|nr:hypothetical protein CIPAW_09G026000 [Carya illinoinensis]KAG6693946.1 hypothetical protein I3842_09G026200 [Carya illinoinensis]